MRRLLSMHLLLLVSAVLMSPSLAYAQISVGVSITVAPPPLVVYAQPPVPAPGYIWTPGYWAWGPDGYYWVPGTWVQPPSIGVLWTPGYWGWSGGVYVWNAGYWGPHIGFYGGINYGFGYVGSGYQGGFWNNGTFNYNRSVNNISNTNITNVYNKTVVNNTTVNNVSYNGGGGTSATPTPSQLAAAHEQHVPFTPTQVQHVQAASANRALLASVNRGKPPIAATARPADFAHNIIPARTSANTGTLPHANGAPGPAIAGHGAPAPRPPLAAGAAAPKPPQPRANIGITQVEHAPPMVNHPAPAATRTAQAAPPHMTPHPAPPRAPPREEKRHP